jgi:hypothetical protein
MSTKRKAWDRAIQQVAKETNAPIKVKRDEKRETRRLNARRWIATSDSDDLRRKVDARIESLDGITMRAEVEDDQDDWVDDAEGLSKHKNKALPRKLKASLDSQSQNGSSVAILMKRYRVRPLAQALLDDHSSEGPSYASSDAAPSKFLVRSICIISGLPGRYEDPNSGLSFFGRSAQEQLKEAPPSWLQSSGNAPLFDALRLMKP